MIDTVIIEDEVRNASVLKNLLKQYCPEVRLIGEADSVKTGTDLILKMAPSLVFLDIEMPDGTAFDMLEQLTEKQFNIVFTTAYDSYALKAIKFSALDYLLKPINFLDLQKVVAKIKSKEIDVASINMLIKNLSSPEKTSLKIAVPTFDGHIFINVKDIIRFEAEGNYSYLYLVNGDKILASRTLKEFEAFIDANDFVRIHHSHLININHIKKYVKGVGGYVIMSDGSNVEVSTRKKEDFFKRMNIK